MKKTICLLLAILLCMSAFAGCASKAPAKTTEAASQTNVSEESKTGDTPTEAPQQEAKETAKIAFISNEAIDSEEWIQNLVAGLQAWEAQHEGYEIQVIEATSVDEYYPKTLACCEAGYDIIITSYSDMAEATIQCAQEYPDIMFGTLDGEIENIQDYKNIQDFRLNRNQTAFVQGCVAALMTKTGKVGFIGGGEYASIDELLAGWQYGIEYINADVEDYVCYTNSFTDPTAGKEYAMSLIAEGCDVIYACAGGSGTGSAQACQESGVMFAACDVHYTEAAPDVELGSTMYYFDVMMLAFIEDAISGNYAPGTSKEYGIAQGAGFYDFAQTNSLVSDEIKTQIAEIEQKIANGEIELSRTPLHK